MLLYITRVCVLRSRTPARYASRFAELNRHREDKNMPKRSAPFAETSSRRSQTESFPNVEGDVFTGQ